MTSGLHGRAAAAAGLATLLAAGAAQAASVAVTITNNQAAGGLYLTPLVSVFHDGTFDPFDAGSAASSAVEELAEDGIDAGIRAEAGAFPNGTITSPGGFPGAPVIDPGETARLRFKVDPSSDRYFSFFSMVIPSNDNFIGNDDPLAYQLFDAAGAFVLAGPIQVLGANVWNAGTEVNDGLGAAFSTAGGTGTDENGVIALQGDLSFLLGASTAAGTTVTSVPGANDLLATIEVAPVPLPAGLPLLALSLAGLGLLRRRA